MKKAVSVIVGVAMCITAQAQIIDTFSGDLSPYTPTRILNANTGDADNVWSWAIGSGSLQINTTTYGGIEQYALTRYDYSLQVGYELTATYSALNLSSQDIGLYVGAATPTPDVRQDYVNVYVRNNGQVYSRGFNGTTELTLSGGSSPAVSSLFIARTAANTFELGYYEGATRTLMTTRTLGNTDIGNVIGFYADVRGAGIRGDLDNLTLAMIPEPSTGVLLGLGLLGAVANYRRRNSR